MFGGSLFFLNYLTDAVEHILQRSSALIWVMYEYLFSLHQHFPEHACKLGIQICKLTADLKIKMI